MDMHAMTNDEFIAITQAAAKIWTDPNETPERQRKAEALWREMHRGSGSAAAIPIDGSAASSGKSANHRGGYFMATDMEYTGRPE
jgi:hypothetical protein